jgi:hypothetical protein
MKFQVPSSRPKSNGRVQRPFFRNLELGIWNLFR